MDSPGDAQRGSRRRDPGKGVALLEAAARLFAGHGYHGTTVRQIAAAAGLATGTFYLYYPTKEAVMLALIARLEEEVMSAILDRRTHQGSVIDKLAASMTAVLAVFARNENLARISLVTAPGLNPVFDDRLAGLHTHFAGLVERDLEEAVTADLIPHGDAEVMSRALIGSLYEVITGWLRDRRPSDLGAAIPVLINYNLRGIGASPEVVNPG